MPKESDKEKVSRWLRGSKKFFGSKKGIILSVIVVLLVVNSIFLGFFFTGTCESFECFQDSMRSCERTNYINDEPEASWGYKIKGEEGNQCVVNVKLLQAKKGELGIDRIVGFDMDCSYAIGLGVYPEKDLSKCHGRLKEELQGIVIEKLHSNILENLGEIEESIAELL